MFLQGWVNGISINESSVYGTLCIVLLKILNMGLYFSEIDTRGWPYRRQDLLLPFNHSFARMRGVCAGNNWEGQAKSNKICEMAINCEINSMWRRKKKKNNLPTFLSFRLLQSTSPGTPT